MKSVEREVSAETAYGLYNFHREVHLARLAEIIRKSLARRVETIQSAQRRSQSARGPSIAVLSGSDGIGRSYLARAAVHRLRRQDRSVRVLPIDLESFDPDEGDALFSFLEHQVRHRKELEAKQREDILSGMRPLLRVSDVASFGKASAISLLLNLEAPLRALRRFFQDGENVSLPQGSDRAFLRHVLEDLAGAGTLVLTAETALLPMTFRRWLVQEAERAGSRVFLAIRAAPDAATEDVAPLDAEGVQRIEIEPLTLEELQGALDLSFDPHDFPPELADTLHARTQGEPGHLAALTYDLMQNDALRTSETPTWHLPPEGVESPEVIEALQADGYEPVEKALGKLESSLAGQVQEFLLHAALGGEIIPADLLFQYLSISGEARDDVLDCLDDDLDEDLGRLEDLGFKGHRSFAGLGLLYRFTSPVFRRIVLNRIDSWGREDRASQLLPFLQEHLPVRNREIARYFLNVCRHLDEKKQEPYLRELAWWVGLEELGELEALLAEAIAAERLDLEALWLAAIDRSDQRWWHPRRRLMFLDLYGQHEMPSDHLARWHLERAYTLRHLGRYRDGLVDAERAVELTGKASPGEWAAAQNILGLIQLSLGEARAAESRFRQAAQALVSGSGPNHRLLLAIEHNLAKALDKRGQYAEAEDLYHRVLEAKTTRLGEDHPQTLITQNGLAQVLRDQGQYAEAEDLYRRVLEANTARLGEDHPDTLNIQHGLAQVLQDQGQYAEAEDFYRRVLEATTTRLGEDHPQTLITQHGLAQVLQLQCQYAEAEDLYRRVLEANTARLGEDHPNTLTTQHNLASLLRKQEQWQEAEERCQAALSGMKLKLGEDHPHTLMSKKLLEEIRKARENSP